MDPARWGSCVSNDSHARSECNHHDSDAIQVHRHVTALKPLRTHSALFPQELRVVTSTFYFHDDDA